MARRVFSGAFLAASWACASFAQAAEPQVTHQVRALKITVLSTMLADAGIGEWGYAALVEVDGKRILFDTGARPETVLANAREMRIELADIEEVVLSHNHDDHTGGLVTLRRELRKQNPRALSKAHVGEGIFLPRTAPNGAERNGLLRFKSEYESMGGTFIVHSKPTQLLPGVWITGPVPRVHPEKNYPQGLKLKSPSGEIADTIPEDSSLVIHTTEGLVVLAGCGHAGIINTIDHARASIASQPVVAVIGGLHTFSASDEVLAWTADKMKAAGLRYFLAGHCTGIEAAFRIRQLAGLDRKTAVVSSVGSSFTLGKGIDPGAIAR
jgi:7,8-dihydropterin-6-yl-methyl-4-(beta-D-ribofuranosyl)aminobenzene 5'-phosphate synthase